MDSPCGLSIPPALMAAEAWRAMTLRVKGPQREGPISGSTRAQLRDRGCLNLPWDPPLLLRASLHLLAGNESSSCSAALPAQCPPSHRRASCSQHTGSGVMAGASEGKPI
ncbi:hypothetical protein AAFF_G00166250 [Aldrovandia affinis]|uniref:Uncharacterized protein n=1 Tax=Aldrovandia affinis TaxID=143900 RepID=A0AAD7RMK3_9TELE|nr:hypothetical protein AAFF_G00166250 [Aldrovandia affinis]